MEDKNWISQLNEHCQKMQLALPMWEFEQEFKEPSMWTAVCVLDAYEGKGSGATKKTAKVIASARLIEKLKEEGIWWEDFQKSSMPIWSRNIRRNGRVHSRNDKFNKPH